MHLTQIDILKYKSIKNPVSISFDEGKVVALIGKNGSGKTNVLEAIKYAMSKNHFYGRDKTECEIKYHIELTDDELNEYFSCVQTDVKSKEIIVDFDGFDLEKRLISSSAIWIEAEQFKIRLDKLLLGFISSSQKYIKALQKIETDYSFWGNYIDVKVEENNRGSLYELTTDRLNSARENIKRQIEELKKYIAEFFDGNRIYLNRHKFSILLHQRFWPIPSFRIPEDEQIKISPLVAKSLGITKRKLDQANLKLNDTIKEINKALDAEYKEMQVCLDEFDGIKDEIAKIFDEKSDKLYELNEGINKAFESIIHKLKSIVFCNCYYLDNENSLIFYDSINRQYRNELTQQEYLNSRNPITESFDLFLRDKGVIDEKTSITQRDKLEEQTIAKAVRLINRQFLPRIVPKFDNNEIIKFEITDNNGSLNLYVHEKNGDIIPFNNTSLGRRWYLTYQFVKALLNPGDMLLIDEPAAFLHPQAQVEFKKELELLAEQGIYVFYSTHSPYMIPEDWGQVYNVAMTEEGTQITKFESGDDLCEVIKQELGATNTANILFNLEKTIILVEGVADKTCIEKFADLLHKDLSDYYIHVCDGEAILQVAYICLRHKALKIKVVLDNDNKYKGDGYKRGHSMYDACIDIINANPQYCIYLGNGKNGCLEDLFVENENSKYKHYKKQKGQWKVDVNAVKKLKSIEDVSEQTKTNFEQLFIKLDIPKLDESKS